MDKELTGTTIENDKIIFGEIEFTDLIKTLIRVYQFRNKNQNPVAVVFPNIKEVDGIKVEFLAVEHEPEVVEDKDEMS